MYRALIIIIMAGGIFVVATAPQNQFSTKKVRQIEFSQPSTNIDNDNPTSIYTDLNQQQSLPVNFYPTYPDYNGKSGLAEQSGYEGYLIPAPTLKQSWTTSIISSLAPLSSYAISFIARAGECIWNLLILLLIGGILTTTVCTLTPFCTITLLGFGLNKNQVREQVTELARAYITPDSLSAATMLVQKAIEKYAEVQLQQRDEEDWTKNKKKTQSRRRR